MSRIDPFVGVAAGALGSALSLMSIFAGVNEWIALGGFAVGFAIFTVNGVNWINEPTEY